MGLPGMHMAKLGLAHPAGQFLKEASQKGCYQAQLRRRTGAHLGMEGIASVRIGFTSWRTVPLLFSSCLALIGALDRDAQKPFCYAS